MRTLSGLILGLILGLHTTSPPAPLKPLAPFQMIQQRQCLDPLKDIGCDSAQFRVFLYSVFPNICLTPKIVERPFLVRCID